MANETVIRQFLVSLGWDVDTAGMNRFATSIAVQSEAVRELGEGLKAAAMKVADFVRDTAKGLDDLYFASVKTKASVAGLEAFSFALEQVGQNGAAGANNVKNLYNLIATNPNEAGWLKENLGVKAFDEKTGKLRDMVVVYREMLAAIAKSPFQKAFLDSPFTGGGIDKTFLDAATSEEATKAFDDFLARQKAAGVNAEEAARRFHNFQNAVRRLNSEIGILQERVLTALLEQWDKLSAKTKQQIKDFLDLGQQIGRLTYWWEHLDQESKSQITSKITAVADAIVDLGKQIGRLIYWWDHLDSGTKSQITTAGKFALALAGLFAGLVAVGSGIKIVTFAFSAFAPVLELAGGLIAALSGPIGWVVLALAGLAVAFQFLPWDKIGADWDAFTAKVKALAEVFTTDLKPVLSDIGELLKDVFTGDWGGVRKQAQAMGGDVTRAWQQGVAALNGQTAASAKRGLRNNNAGNIEYGAFAREHGATGVEAAGRFATFATAQEGLNAAAALLRSYAAHGIDSVEAIMSKYAPAKGKDGKLENDTAAYIAYVAKRMGVSADAHLNLNDPAQLAQIERAIVQFENGSNPYSAEMYDRAARNATGRDAPAAMPIINQTITTTVTGASDPQAAGKAISGAIDKGNSLLVRSLQGRTS